MYVSPLGILSAVPISVKIVRTVSQSRPCNLLAVPNRCSLVKAKILWVIDASVEPTNECSLHDVHRVQFPTTVVLCAPHSLCCVVTWYSRLRCSVKCPWGDTCLCSTSRDLEVSHTYAIVATIAFRTLTGPHPKIGFYPHEGEISSSSL